MQISVVFVSVFVLFTCLGSIHTKFSIAKIMMKIEIFEKIHLLEKAITNSTEFNIRIKPKSFESIFI